MRKVNFFQKEKQTMKRRTLHTPFPAKGVKKQKERFLHTHSHGKRVLAGLPTVEL